MTCPFSRKTPVESSDENSLTYSSYLKLDSLLDCTKPLTEVHDEHLFIAIHQVYELWFKQIIHELDSVMSVFSKQIVDDRNMLTVNTRLGRVAKIYSILVEQVTVLETMAPLDFAGFREELQSASGFQSWQFRLIENKLGVRKENRIKFNKNDYNEIYIDECRALVDKSEKNPSLFELVEKWLERTPAFINRKSTFWEMFVNKCDEWFEDDMRSAREEIDERKREQLIKSCDKTRATYEQILHKAKYDALLEKGERCLSWKAMQGALMIFYNRNEVVFHEAFQMLNHLMDIDSHVCRWRYNHTLLVQRQIGSKLGSGGSSGYYYLRSTISDRYRPFLDLFHLSNYLIPVKYVKDMLPN